MTALFNALDNYTPSQIGENGHSEFTWSNSTREKILQLSFQLTRCKDEKQIHKIAEYLEILINFSELDYGYKHKIKLDGSK